MSRIFRKPDRLPHLRYILLIGPPRSGTTLLATMIGRHSDIGMLNEDITGKGLKKVLGKPMTGNKLCVPNQIQLNRRRGLFLTLLRKLGIIAESPRSKTCILDYLELPNLKLIAIIRNGNDSVSSMMARGKTPFRKAARRWSEGIETIYELRKRYAKRVLVLSFEELVLSPEKTMALLCKFLGVELQEQMFDGYKFNRYYPGTELDKEKAHRYKKDRVDFQLEELMPTAYGKYQRLLSEAERCED